MDNTNVVPWHKVRIVMAANQACRAHKELAPLKGALTFKASESVDMATREGAIVLYNPDYVLSAAAHRLRNTVTTMLSGLQELAVPDNSSA